MDTSNDQATAATVATRLTARTARRLAQLSALALALSSLVGCENAPRPAKGTYRLPFVDGTTVRISNSFFNHNGEFDMYKPGAAPGSLAAAAAGWVRFIEDSNAEPTSSNNYIWIEHPQPYCQKPGVTWPGKPANYDQTCIPCDLTYCNEWSKYSHVATGTATTNGLVLVNGAYYAYGAGLTEDQWVEPGDYLGVEGDVGQATGVHVHWEVVILNPNDPINGGGFSKDWTGDAWQFAPNLMPYVCTGPGGDTPVSPYLLDESETYDAQPCSRLSALALSDRRLVEDATDTWLNAVREGGDVVDALWEFSLSLPARETTRALDRLRRIVEVQEARHPRWVEDGATAPIHDLLDRLDAKTR